MSSVFDSTLKENQPLACSILESAIKRNQLAQAYLLSGRNEPDKWQIAQQLAAYLNCTNESRATKGSCLLAANNGYAVHLCSNCKWISQKAHPQAWIVLEPGESKSGRIPVEKARQLGDELAKTSQYFRTVLIPSATEDSFHRPAANALLKTIEEPGPNTVFLLFAAQIEMVLSTIVSRCQTIALSGAGHRQLDSPAAAKLQDLQQQLSQPIAGCDFSSVRTATVTVSSTLKWSNRLQELAEAEDNAPLIVDLVLQREFGKLRLGAPDNPALSLYLNSLLSLAELTKDQIEHYVQLKAAMDSFALSCRELSQIAPGETSVE